MFEYISVSSWNHVSSAGISELVILARVEKKEGYSPGRPANKKLQVTGKQKDPQSCRNKKGWYTQQQRNNFLYICCALTTQNEPTQ